jgi:predicted molibdopterin-dependent oxidoreductase YjgC
MRQAGTWDESCQTQTDTICPYCGVGCDLSVHQQEDQIVSNGMRSRHLDFSVR